MLLSALADSASATIQYFCLMLTFVPIQEYLAYFICRATLPEVSEVSEVLMFNPSNIDY
jgi:hypothetical protein